MTPDRVLLSCIGYRVTVSEGMVLFASEPGVAGCYTRMAFQRINGCWYVTLADSDDKTMVSHIVQAYSLVCTWFGDNFKGLNGPEVP